MSNSERTRSEVRQFLVALAALAFLFSALGLRDGGPLAFAADIVLVLCGGWCANQLIRGFDVFKAQVSVVLQAYFVGLFCCAVALFGLGWLVFLPSEFANLGQGFLHAATFTTNLQLAFLPSNDSFRFDPVLDHLWLPALIAQCCAILGLLYWCGHRNERLLLAALVGLFAVSLSTATSDSPVVQMLPLGGMWAFLAGAIPFIAASRYALVRYALLLGIVFLVSGLITATITGDSVVARALLAMSFSFLYLGSRPKASPVKDTQNRRKWFGLVLHLFLWALPLAHVAKALNLSHSGSVDYAALVVPSLFLAAISWALWQQIEMRDAWRRMAPSGAIAMLLLGYGVTTLSSHGADLRFSDTAKAYVHALDPDRAPHPCPEETTGPLAGLNVCKIGPDGPPAVLIWGDHQLAAMQSGFAEAARSANVSGLLVAYENCIPVDGLQTRFAMASGSTGRQCDRNAAQVLQAIPHLTSLEHVTLVADWRTYFGVKSSAIETPRAIRLGPIDGTPINGAQQQMYVADAAATTIDSLGAQGLRVSVLRQVPAQPYFDAELSARAETPGRWLYQDMPRLDTAVSREVAETLNGDVDQLLGPLAAAGKVRYIDTWAAFCSEDICSARGGLASDYVNSTELTASGALSLVPVLRDDLELARHNRVKHAAMTTEPHG